MKVKLIVGFRRDQEHSIDAEEAHKAYYLFLNPDARTIFNSGLAIKGNQIQEIVPDWHGTMGWNPTHNLDSDDWNHMHQIGVASKLPRLLSAAKEIAMNGDASDINIPLTSLMEQKYPQLTQANPHSHQNKLSSMKELLSAKTVPKQSGA